MLQIQEQTHEEKVKMYSKLTKKELIEMLIEANRQLNRPPFIDGGLWFDEDEYFDRYKTE